MVILSNPKLTFFFKLLQYTFIRLTRNTEEKYTGVFGGYPQWGEITFIHLCFTKNECVMKIPCGNKGHMKI
jgi:hypothetical protein